MLSEFDLKKKTEEQLKEGWLVLLASLVDLWMHVPDGRSATREELGIARLLDIRAQAYLEELISRGIYPEGGKNREP